jgi:hypothetical protein
MTTQAHVDGLTPLLLPTALVQAVEPAELTALIRRHLTEKAAYARRAVDAAGLTTQIAPPLVAPARVRFRDVQTGKWIEGISEPKIDPNMFRLDLTVQAYAPCARQAHWGRSCGCKKRLTGASLRRPRSLDRPRPSPMPVRQDAPSQRRWMGGWRPSPCAQAREQPPQPLLTRICRHKRRRQPLSR